MVDSKWFKIISSTRWVWLESLMLMWQWKMTVRLMNGHWLLTTSPWNLIAQTQGWGPSGQFPDDCCWRSLVLYHQTYVLFWISLNPILGNPLHLGNVQFQVDMYPQGYQTFALASAQLSFMEFSNLILYFLAMLAKMPFLVNPKPIHSILRLVRYQNPYQKPWLLFAFRWGCPRHPRFILSEHPD